MLDTFQHKIKGRIVESVFDKLHLFLMKKKKKFELCRPSKDGEHMLCVYPSGKWCKFKLKKRTL